MSKAKKVSLLQTFKEKGIHGNRSEIVKFINSHRVGVLKQSGGHSYGKNGSEIKLQTNGGGTVNSGSGSSGGYLTNQIKASGGLGNTIYFSEMTLLESPLSLNALNQGLKDVAKEQKELTAKKKDIKDKIAFLKETGVTEFSENEYKAYMTLKTFKDESLTDVQKAQAIAKLIDG